MQKKNVPKQTNKKQRQNQRKKQNKANNNKKKQYKNKTKQTKNTKSKEKSKSATPLEVLPPTFNCASYKLPRGYCNLQFDWSKKFTPITIGGYYYL